jgi:hypothetical protein
MLGQYALVTVNWRVQRIEMPKEAPVTCETTARIKVPNGVSAIVKGYQQAIANIADEIAVEIGIGRGTAPRCGSNW